jgi:hypothetical protein
LLGCKSSADAAPEVRAPTSAQRCVLFLHGKSGAGFEPQLGAGYLRLGPAGNADGWGGKQWLYFPAARLAEVRRIVAKALDDHACRDAIVHGFSNGGAAAAKLYCSGESFGGRVAGYLIDDPVPDHGADICAPAAAVRGRLYWTGTLEAPDAWKCAERDWTCDGGTTVGIWKYAANLKLQAARSASRGHTPYADPPEYQSWWRATGGVTRDAGRD